DQHLHGRAIRVGDDAARPAAHLFRVDLAHHQRHVVVVAEGRGVVDHHRAGSGELRGVLLRRVAAGGEQRDVDAGGVEGRQVLDDVVLATVLDDAAGRPLGGERNDLADREIALGEDRQHHFADSAGGADDGDIETTVLWGVHGNGIRKMWALECGQVDLHARDARAEAGIRGNPRGTTGRWLPYRFAAAFPVTGVGGLPACGPRPSAAVRLSTARLAIARRVARLALPTCGVSTTLRSASSFGLTAGSPSNTSSAAEASRPPSSAAASASSSTSPPRAMLVRVAVGFIFARAAASITWRVCAEYGRTSTRWSESRSSVSKSTYVARQLLSTPTGSRLRLW